jgi:hypothetical protein
LVSLEVIASLLQAAASQGALAAYLANKSTDMLEFAIEVGWPSVTKKQIGSYNLVRVIFVVFCFGQTALLVERYFRGRTADPLLVFLSFALCLCCFGLIWIYLAKRDRFFASIAFILTTLAVVTLLIAFAHIYRIFGIIEASTHAVSQDAIDCFYFSIVTFTTLGYGDFYPRPEIRLVAACEAIVGYLSLAALIGVFTHFWGQLGADNPN